jgi:hypothetical protein
MLWSWAYQFTHFWQFGDKNRRYCDIQKTKIEKNMRKNEIMLWILQKSFYLCTAQRLIREYLDEPLDGFQER